MLNWCMLKIAERDSNYCEQMLMKTKGMRLDSNVPCRWQWVTFMRSQFLQDSNRRLILILDGVDECEKGGLLQLVTFFSRAKSLACRIQVIMTSGPEIATKLARLATQTIELTEEKIAPDLRRFASFQVQTLSRIPKLRSNIRRSIVSRVSKQANCKKIIALPKV